MKNSPEFWLDRVAKCEEKLNKFRKNGRNIVARYRGRSSDGEDRATLNLHWSNLQMLLATVYARTPQPEVVRRWKDNPDSSAQNLAETMQACLKFSLDQYDFDEVMESVLVDHWNTALGQVRLRYKPYIQPVKGPNGPVMEQIPVFASEDLVDGKLALKFATAEGVVVDTAKVQGEGPYFIQGEPMEEVAYEEVYCEYVPWDRFGWDVDAPTWNDVKFAYIAYDYTKQEFVSEFGAKYVKDVDFDKEDADHKEMMIGRVRVFEIFDKQARKVIVVAKGIDGFLKEQDDPYHLEDFFPFPKPLFGTITSDKLIPVPIFQIVQDLYYELDDVQRRIRKLVKMLKVRGVYNAQYADGLKDILDKDDGYVAPIEQWQEFAEKGGLQNALDFIPLEQVYGALQTLQNHREGLIQKIYEITGLSDIIRGSTRASESAAAQKIKNEYMSTRINREVKRVSRFIRDVLRLMAEMLAEHFQTKTVQLITGKPVMEEEWQQLRSDVQRAYKIDVQTDSMLIDNESAEVERRSGVTNAIAGLLQAYAPVAMQGWLPPEAVKEIILFNVRSTSRGRELEKFLEPLNLAPMPTEPMPQ